MGVEINSEYADLRGNDGTNMRAWVARYEQGEVTGKASRGARRKPGGYRIARKRKERTIAHLPPIPSWTIVQGRVAHLLFAV